MLKKSISLILALVLAFGCFGAIGFSAETEAEILAVSNNDFAVIAAEMVKEDGASMLRIIGKLREGASAFDFADACDSAVSENGMFVLQFANEADLNACLRELNASPDVLFAERDMPVYTEAAEKSSETLSWGSKAIEADVYAEAITPAADGFVTVAIIDSGVEDIDYLKDRLVEGYDFFENDSDADDDISEDSHGTFLASIIADCTGTLPVKFMPVRVLDTDAGSLINVVNGIIYAADNGADVINISLCAPLLNCRSLESAVAYAESKNIPVVTCAGNVKSNTLYFCPSHCETAITVSAIDVNNNFCIDFSNYGKEVYLCAPGGAITGYNAQGELTVLSGTSMSTAYVSAAVSMFLLDNPNCNTNQVREALKSCALDLGIDGKDDYYGWGIPKLSKLAESTTVYVESVEFANRTFTAKIGDKIFLNPTVAPADATNKAYFLTADSNVVSVSGGAITALCEGTANVTVTTADGLYTDTVELTVLAPKIKIQNNTGTKTINYGETLYLTAVTENLPADAEICWYVNGQAQTKGEKFAYDGKANAVIEAKLVLNGSVMKYVGGIEMSDTETVTVKSGFFQKLISFFKNLFGISRIVVQSIKYM